MSTEYLDKNGLGQVWDKINNKFYCGTPTAIPSNVDLNDYVTPGHYTSPNAATTATLSNSPFVNGNGFEMFVGRWGIDTSAM